MTPPPVPGTYRDPRPPHFSDTFFGGTAMYPEAVVRPVDILLSWSHIWP